MTAAPRAAAPLALCPRPWQAPGGQALTGAPAAPRGPAPEEVPLSAPPAPDAPTTPMPEGEVDAKKLLWQLVVGVVLIILLFAGLGYFVQEPVEAFAKAWVNATGLVGLFAATVVLDSLPAPIPPDVFMGFALLGGKSLWQASLVTGVASVFGGNLAWLLGRSSARIAWVRRLLEGRGKQSAYLVARNARLAIVLGALTPLPFSVSCIAGGAVGMPWVQLFPLTLLRIPRMMFYLYIMQLGWVSVTG